MDATSEQKKMTLSLRKNVLLMLTNLLEMLKLVTSSTRLRRIQTDANKLVGRKIKKIEAAYVDENPPEDQEEKKHEAEQHHCLGDAHHRGLHGHCGAGHQHHDGSREQARERSIAICGRGETAGKMEFSAAKMHTICGTLVQLERK